MPPVTRVAFLSPSAVAGGAERVLTTLARALPDHGVEPLVLILGEGPMGNWLRGGALETITLPAGRVRDPRWVIATTRAVREACHANGVRVLVSNMGKGQLLGALATLGTDTASVWWSHGIPRNRSIGWDRISTFLPSSAIVAVSDAVAAGHRTMWPARQVTRIYNGVPSLPLDAGLQGRATSIREKLGWSGNPIVGIVGRLQPWKGQETFLRAAAQVIRSHPMTRFVLVGGAILGWEGDYPEQLQVLTRSLGLDPFVKFIDHQSDVAPWYAALDVVVNASVGEPFGTVILEAMSAGSAVVVTASGGNTEIVRHEVDGLVVPVSDSTSLASAICRLLADSNLREKLATTGTHVHERFSVDLMASQWAELLRSVASAGSVAHA